MAVKARVVLHLEHTPERFKVNDAMLAALIGVQEETRVGIIAGLWNYIKAKGLQDKVHPTTIKFDQKLTSVSVSPLSDRCDYLRADVNRTDV